jgi:hypothetical protein
MAVKRCPLADISQFSLHMLGHFARYRDHGVLPHAGGSADQDARVLQALDVLEAEARDLRAVSAGEVGRRRGPRRGESQEEQRTVRQLNKERRAT